MGESFWQEGFKIHLMFLPYYQLYNKLCEETKS